METKTERFVIKDITGNIHAASDRPVVYIENEDGLIFTFDTYEEASNAIGVLKSGIYKIEKIFIR